MTLTKKPTFWALLFLLIFLLSQDYLFTDWSNKPFLFGLPVWIYWFGFVHVLYIAAFYWFAKTYWKS